METGTARYGPVRRVVWGPEANYLRLPDSAEFSSLIVPDYDEDNGGNKTDQRQAERYVTALALASDRGHGENCE